jgi:hypothetical protein
MQIIPRRLMRTNYVDLLKVYMKMKTSQDFMLLRDV